MAVPTVRWRSQQDVALPRAIDPNKFAAAREPEIVAITDAVKKSEFLGEHYGIDGIPRHLRRRTKSHNPYKHRKRPNVLKGGLAAAAAEQNEGGSGGSAGNKDDDAVPRNHPPFTNRKMRRRPGKINEAALESARWTESTCIRDDQQQLCRRCLETHVWHAKRLSMQSTFNGWVLPEGEPGRGRGSRSFLRRLEKSCTAAILHDASYWCPLSMTGPCLQVIMTCLKHITDPRIAAEIANKLENDKGKWEVETMLHRPNTFPLGALSPSFIDVLRDTEMLVIWVHAAAVAEAYTALQEAIKLEATDGVIITLKVLDLRRLEVRGQGSDTAIAKALFSNNNNNSTSSIEEKGEEEEKISSSSSSSSSSLPELLQRLQPGEAVHISVADSRLVKPIVLGCSSINLLHDQYVHEQEEENKENSLFRDSEHPLPLSEAAISHARQLARQHLVLGETDASIPSSSLSLENRSHCATLFIRQKGSSSFSAGTGNGGWSIIVPRGWAMPVWLPLIFQGCRATGQREWRWYHTLEQRPFFPVDAVDTPAYSVMMHTLRQQREEVEKKKPKGKKTPLLRQQWLPPPWDILVERENTSKDMLFVARSESEMLKAVFGVNDASGLMSDENDEQSGGSKEKSSSRRRRAVKDALAAGRLQWQPKQEQQQQSNPCLVQVSVQCIKRGAAENGAAVCVIKERAGECDHHHHHHPCYLRENESPDDEQSPYIDTASLTTIGYVTSAAPCGAGRGWPSVAACAASAFWRLRSLQYSESSRCDGGTVNAWMMNPGSSALFPVRLSLVVEK